MPGMITCGKTERIIGLLIIVRGFSLELVCPRTNRTITVRGLSEDRIITRASVLLTIARPHVLGEPSTKRVTGCGVWKLFPLMITVVGFRFATTSGVMLLITGVVSAVTMRAAMLDVRPSAFRTCMLWDPCGEPGIETMMRVAVAEDGLNGFPLTKTVGRGFAMKLEPRISRLIGLCSGTVDGFSEMIMGAGWLPCC